MKKTNIVLLCCTTLCLLALCRVTAQAQPRPEKKRPAAKHAAALPGRVIPEPAGLVLVALGQDGFALAADGAQANRDGTLSETQKIMPVGKQAAVVVAGTVSIQDPLGLAVRQELNVVRVAASWLNTHPDASFADANREINAQVAEGAKKFFSTRKPGTEAGKEKFALVFAGYVDGKPRVTITRYFMPLAMNKPMRASTASSEAKAGDLWVLGAVQVEQELLSGPANGLPKFKIEPAVAKYRSSKYSDLAARDLTATFAVVLKATESGEGQKFARSKLTVAPPNKFATITPAGGFAWASE